MKKILCLMLSVIIFALTYKVEVCAVGFDISAKAAVLIDAQTGCVLYEKNKDMRLPMASTTKIMTTILTLESGDLDTEFTIDSRALLTEGSSMYLAEGDVVTKRELCYGMMLPSGNDAANASALKIGGEYDSFAKKMNSRASEIGMSNTSFVTPSGLHDKNHYSSAYDMAMLTETAMENEVFREICSTSKIKLTDDSWKYSKYLTNSNKLLSRYDGCIGVKTGFTDEAGRCLISAAERDGVMLIAVTLNAPDDWNDHIKMLEYGFGITEYTAIEAAMESCEVSVVGGDSDKVKCTLSEQPCVAAINGKLPEIEEKVYVNDFIYAPVIKGDCVGTVKYFVGNKQIFEAELVAQENCYYKNTVVEKSFMSWVIDCLKGLFKD